MRKILSVLMALVLLSVAVMAEETITPVETTIGIGFDLDIDPGNSCPEIDQESVMFMVHTWTDEVPDSWGPVPNGLGWEDLLDIAYTMGWAGRSYAFDGEFIAFSFDAYDADGIMDDCVQGYVTLDDGVDPRVVQCTKELDQENGNSAHFHCRYYVEDAETRNGEHWVSVEVSDSCGDGCSDVAPGEISLFLNPAVGLTMKTQGTQDFEFAYDLAGDVLAKVVNGELVTGPRAGDSVYTPWFVIENSADPESGLYILLQIYGTDFRADIEGSDEVPLCPVANRLEIENMFYTARHLNAEQGWTMMPDGTNYGFLDADYVFTSWTQAPYNGGANFLGVGDDLSMRLRLDIPSPCKGVFNMGGDVVFIGRVI